MPVRRLPHPRPGDTATEGGEHPDVVEGERQGGVDAEDLNTAKSGSQGTYREA